METPEINWKSRCLEAEKELNEYQTTSAEFEAELEKELQEKEQELLALSKKYYQLQHDTENTISIQKSRILELQQTNSIQENKLKELTDLKNVQTDKIRKYEQEIDDLQKVERQGLASVACLEGKLCSQIEKNAFLEADLEEKSRSLEMECQRLKDLNRDILLDLEVTKNNKNNLVNHREVLLDFQEKNKNNQNSCNSPFFPAGPLSSVSNSSSPDCIKNSSTSTTVNSDNSVEDKDSGYKEEQRMNATKKVQQKSKFTKFFNTLKRSTSFKKSKRTTSTRNRDNK